VSGQQSKLDMWAKFDRTKDPKDDPYYILGKALGIADEQARSVGKTADLAFGYCGGKGAWEKLAPADDASTEDEIKQRQLAWRREHPETVRFWHRATRAAVRAVRKPGRRCECGRVAFESDGTFLRMHLPSGRSLAYPFPELKADKYGDVTVVFKDNAAGKFVPCRYGQGAYGGTWTENCVQAVARDLFAAAMIRLEAAGYPIVLHVHDEIVAEVPDDFGSPEEFLSILTAAPAWAPGLPIAAKVRNGPRFCKTNSIKRDIPVHDDSPSIQPDASDTPPWEDAPEPEPAQATNGNGKEAPRARAKGGYHLWDETDEEQRYEPCWDEPEPKPRRTHNSGRAFNGYRSGERRTGSDVEAYIYDDPGRHPYLKVLRTSTKQFPQFHMEDGEWKDGKPSGPKLPYRLPELIAAPPDEEVYICEGEKDASNVAALGLVATTNSEGAGKWGDDLDRWFIGKQRVVICEDNDDAGRAHATDVVEHMRRIGVKDIRVISFPELDEHGDVSDWIDQGYGKQDLIERARAAPAAAPMTLGEEDAGDDVEPPPPRGWLLGNVFARTFVSSLLGPGGTGKTAVRYAQCLALATGRPITGEHVFQRCRVLIVSLEDDRNELIRRLFAARKHHKIDHTEIKGWLFRVAPGSKVGKLVELDDRGRAIRGALKQILEDAIERRRIDLVCLDPFIKTHAVDENVNKLMDAVVEVLTDLGAKYDIAVDIPHHTRKGPADPGNADSGRGASAQKDAGRLVYTLTVMSADEAKAFGIDEEQRRLFVRMDSGKVNIAPPMWKAKWFRLVGVQLDNATALYPRGDEVQTVEPWTPPEIWQDLDGATIQRILDRIDAGMPNGDRYSAAASAKARAAWRVVVEETGKTEAQAREIIKTWVKNGTLESYLYKNSDSKEVEGLRVKGS
jgi:hypothetical protein